jgi:DNA-binding beta-propeller fold protein YncE
MKSQIFSARLLAVVLVLLATAVQPARAGKKEAKSTTVQAENLVWPLPPDKPRVRFLRQYSNNLDIEPRKKRSWVDKMVGNADPNHLELFAKPAGVAIDSRGRLIFASLQNSVVYILDPEGHKVTRVQGGRGIVLQTPLGVTVDSRDNIFVSDPLQHLVFKFDKEGNLVSSLGASDGMKNPTFMAIDEARRRLYIVDSHLHQVLVYNVDTLQFMDKFGQRGEKKGEFNFPVGIAIAKDGTIAVSDTGSCSVQLFTPDFKFIRRFGQRGTRPGELTRPKAVAFDNEGHVWVVDAAFNNVQIFSDKGVVLMPLGAFGNTPGAFNLPLGIYIDATDKVYISDQLNHRVQIFQFLGGN